MILRVCFFGRENATFLFDFVAPAPDFNMDFRLLNKKNRLFNGWKMKMDGGIAMSEMNGSDFKNWFLVGSMV